MTGRAAAPGADAANRLPGAISTESDAALEASRDEAVAGDMYRWARDLYPVNRSLTGPGVRETLDYLGALLPGLRRHTVASGSAAFDWTVPDEWNLRDAFVEDERGERLIDAATHNLHVVGYSMPIDAWMTVSELDAHLHSLPAQPDVIPYVTSYYRRRWGFCLPHAERLRLTADPDRRVHVVVDGTLAPGHLDYADLLLPGASADEVLFSADICHPSLANNELSGPVVQTALARWVSSMPERRLSYRFVYQPETIGALAYLSRNLGHLRAHTRAGYVLTCLGDERTYGYLASRTGTTLADRVARHVLDHRIGQYDRWSFLDRGSDERQYCAPGVDLPVCSVMRSKYGTYPEYHTSADDLDLISPTGLAQSLAIYQEIVTVLEANLRYRVTTCGEPQLGARGLYPTLSTLETYAKTRRMMNILAYADGTLDLIDLAETIGEYAHSLIPLVDTLTGHGLLVVAD